MVLGLVLDDARHLEAVEAFRAVDRRLDPDPRELVLQDQPAFVTTADEPRRSDRAAGAERVQVAHVRFVLEGDELRDAVVVDQRPARAERLRPRTGEAVELVDLSVHEAPPPVGQRVDERAADPDRLALDEVEHPVELLVADEHVPVHLVARAAADRVVRMVAEQVAPGEPQVCGRIRRAFPQRAQGRRRLDREQPALRALIRLLEVDPRRVDAAQEVLEPAADELALVHGECVRPGCVLVVAADPELRAERPLEPAEDLR